MGKTTVAGIYLTRIFGPLDHSARWARGGPGDLGILYIQALMFFTFDGKVLTYLLTYGQTDGRRVQAFSSLHVPQIPIM